MSASSVRSPGQQHIHRRSASHSVRLNMNVPSQGPLLSGTTSSKRHPSLRPLAGTASRSSRLKSFLASVLSPRRLRQLSIPALLLLVLWYLFSPSRPYSGTSSTSGSLASNTEHEVPVVDRSVASKLKKLESYIGATNEHAEQGEDPDEVRYLNLQDDVQAPRVEGIPEPVKVPKAPAPNGPQRKFPSTPADVADASFCPPSTGCRFLFAAFIGEQETKGQQHLYQMGLLATALNRTLVLPNVVRSRLGSCFANPFSYYYAPDSLDQLGVQSVSQSDFLQWANSRDPPPSAQVINMALPKSDYHSGAIEIDSTSIASWVAGKPDRKLCLQAPRTWLNFSNFSPMAIFPPANWHKTEESRNAFGEGVINTLSSPDVAYQASRAEPKPKKGQAPEADVLVMNYELRYPMLSTEALDDMALQGKLAASSESLGALQPFTHFPYSPQWLKLAENIAADLSPYVAIHWRQETLPIQALSPCTDSLIDFLRGLALRMPRLKMVYLATDYPLEDLESGKEGVVAHSGTFAKLLTDDHHRAMRKLLRAFDKNEVGGLQLQTYERLQKAGRVRLDQSTAESGMHVDLGALDSGLLGIVDKNVAMLAESFLTAVPDVCGKASSFTRQITLDRETKFDASLSEHGGNTEDRQPGAIWDAVQYWGGELEAQAEGQDEQEKQQQLVQEQQQQQQHPGMKAQELNGGPAPAEESRRPTEPRAVPVGSDLPKQRMNVVRRERA